MKTLEYAQAEDTYCDFMLWEYKPVASTARKLRTATLLFHSFEVAGFAPRVLDWVQAIRDGIGELNTVWGVKQVGGRLAWEFYFYDYRRQQRQRSMTWLKDVVRPFAGCRVPVNEQLPYFMFSIDIDELLVTGARNIEEIHMYIGNTGSTVSSGICYSLKESGTQLENFYFFFDPRTEMEKIAGKAGCSAHVDESGTNLDQILWPELRNCNVIILANKQNNDGVYFSRINIEQLIFFLNRLGYPREICRFIEERRAELDHQLYDVGFDYRVEGGKVVVLKSGYYGLF
jgi:hypothetical protein